MQHTRGHLLAFHARWLETVSLSKALTLSSLRLAIRLHYYSQRTDSINYYLKTGIIYCWPSVERLAYDLQLSLDTIRRSAKYLEDARLIMVTYSSGGRTRTNHYKLLPQTNNPPIAERKTPRSSSGGITLPKPILVMV